MITRTLKNTSQHIGSRTPSDKPSVLATDGWHISLSPSINEKEERQAPKVEEKAQKKVEK